MNLANYMLNLKGEVFRNIIWVNLIAEKVKKIIHSEEKKLTLFFYPFKSSFRILLNPFSKSGKGF